MKSRIIRLWTVAVVVVASGAAWVLYTWNADLLAVGITALSLLTMWVAGLFLTVMHGVDEQVNRPTHSAEAGE